MKLFFSLCLAASFLTAQAPNPAFAPIQDDPALPRVLLIGDSISIGYTLPVRRLLGVGRATERVLQELGITTVAELRAQPFELLTRRFGSHGRGLYQMSRGIDERPVRPHHERKSLGHERTYARDLAHLDQMDAQLQTLGEKVAAELVERRLKARTITLKVRYPDFTTLTRARTFAQPTTALRGIVLTAQELLRQTDAAKRHVRLLGVSASGLSHDGAPGQLWLFEWPLGAEETSK